MVNYEISKEIIGKGSHGTIYATSEKNIVVKCSKTIFSSKHTIFTNTNIAIPNFIELIIMNSIKHPNINSAKDIKINSEFTFIFQERAVDNLENFIKKNKENFIPFDKIHKWMFEIASGVKCLHSMNFIHGDIKCQNVLLFKDDTIKLSDFSLSRKQICNDFIFNKPVCTLTHKPLEGFFEWDASLDIWSLGITFYEMVYFESPITKEGFELPEKKYIAINKIIEFIKINGNDSIEFLNFCESKYTPSLKNKSKIIISRKTTFDSNKYSEEYVNVNIFISKILIGEALKRPSINEIISDKFFVGFKFTEGTFLGKNIEVLNNEYVESKYIKKLDIDHPEEILFIKNMMMKMILLDLSDKRKLNVLKFFLSRILDENYQKINLEDILLVLKYFNYRIF